MLCVLCGSSFIAIVSSLLMVGLLGTVFAKFVCGVLLSHADEEDKKAIKDEVCVVVCVGCVLCVAFVLLVSEYYCVVCCALCVV